MTQQGLNKKAMPVDLNQLQKGQKYPAVISGVNFKNSHPVLVSVSCLASG